MSAIVITYAIDAVIWAAFMYLTCVSITFARAADHYKRARRAVMASRMGEYSAEKARGDALMRRACKMILRKYRTDASA